jgi:hypothetical protein
VGNQYDQRNNNYAKLIENEEYIKSMAQRMRDYYQQNKEKHLETCKKYYEIKGTTDTFFERQKSNYNEEDARNREHSIKKDGRALSQLKLRIGKSLQ